MEAFPLFLLDVEQGIHTAVDAGMEYEAVEEAFRELVEIVNGVKGQVKEPTECFI